MANECYRHVQNCELAAAASHWLSRVVVDQSRVSKTRHNFSWAVELSCVASVELQSARVPSCDVIVWSGRMRRVLFGLRMRGAVSRASWTNVDVRVTGKWIEREKQRLIKEHLNTCAAFVFILHPLPHIGLRLRQAAISLRVSERWRNFFNQAADGNDTSGPDSEVHRRWPVAALPSASLTQTPPVHYSNSSEGSTSDYRPRRGSRQRAHPWQAAVTTSFNAGF